MLAISSKWVLVWNKQTKRLLIYFTFKTTWTKSSHLLLNKIQCLNFHSLATKNIFSSNLMVTKIELFLIDYKWPKADKKETSKSTICVVDIKKTDYFDLFWFEKHAKNFFCVFWKVYQEEEKLEFGFTQNFLNCAKQPKRKVKLPPPPLCTQNVMLVSANIFYLNDWS